MLSSNATDPAGRDLPPLPAYSTSPAPDLLPGIPDSLLATILPVVFYWALSGIFHVVDVCDLLPHYRLHTPEEITRRNHATRWEVARDVVFQQVIQVAFGTLLSAIDEPAIVGRDEYDVAVWATRVRLAQRAVPVVLGLVGLDAAGLSESVSAQHPLIAGALAGGHYPFLTTELSGGGGGGGGGTTVVPAFAAWELAVAHALYWAVVPAVQFLTAIFILDTWQYFLHRIMHMNKWLYTRLHSRHHRLYVPYAYGALYNHPVEGFILDTLGGGIAYLLTGMTGRQGMVFFSVGTIKTVDDHCGYALPWDPLQLVSSNNAAYHDIHHQAWGIKSNFSQPFLIVWDRILGTEYKGPRKNAIEERKAKAAQASQAVQAEMQAKAR